MTLRAFLKNFFHVTDEEFKRNGVNFYARNIAGSIGVDDSAEISMTDEGDWFFTVRENEIACMFNSSSQDFREVSFIHGEDVNLIKNAAMQLGLEGVL